jgi:hypothetical protein
MSNAIMSSLMPTLCIDDAIDYTKFAGKSWQEKMDICNECNCCELHKFKKPNLLVPFVRAYDYIDLLDDTKELWYKDCWCKCRYLARRMCEEDNYNIMCASPSPSDLPMPPQEWLKKEDADELSLLDWATDEALEYYWKSQVKACQYAIFHVC